MRKHFGLLIFLAVLSIYLLSLNGVWATDHPSSFVQLDWSIWSNHAFSVNDTQSANNSVYSMDDFGFGGQWYIASAPGTSFFSLPFAIPAFVVSGYTPFGDVLISTEVFVALMGAITVLLTYEISRMFFETRTSVFLAFALAFSTLLWPFATYYFQHDVSAAFDLLASHFALKVSMVRSNDTKKGAAQDPTVLTALCGLAIAGALLVDYVNILLIPVFAIYIAYSARNNLAGFVKREGYGWQILTFMAGSLAGVATMLAYNLSAFGSIITTSQNLYDKKPLLGDFTTPLYQGLFVNFLSPYRGLFIYCPFLILAPFGFYLMLRHRSQKSQILLFLAIFLLIVVPYSMWQDVTAGVSFGPRFVIPAIPFLLLPVGEVLERYGSLKNLAYFLFGIGVIVNGSAALVSVIYPNFPITPPWTTEIILPVIAALASGKVDVWWGTTAGAYWWAIAASLIIAAISLPIVAERFMMSAAKEENLKERCETTIELKILPKNRVLDNPSNQS
jgi:hypothetical protein